MNGVASDRIVRSTPSRRMRSTCFSMSKNVVLSLEMHAANVEIDRITLPPLDLDGEFAPRLGEAKEFSGTK